jgi:nitrite reductase/ring-hydroxylating ferredoxin subunit
MTAQVVVCELEEIPNPGSRAFSIGEGPWPLRGFVVRRARDIFAYVNRCPHAGHPLNMRPDEFLTEDRALILCNSHGALFDIADGACVAGPCAGQALVSLPVRIEGNAVVIEGEPNALVERFA